MDNTISKDPDRGHPADTRIAAAADQIEFSITWQEPLEGALIRLVDNDVAIDLPAAGVRGRQALGVAYRTAAAAQHVIEWRLAFAGHTLTNLAATARRAGKDPAELNDSDEARDVWASSAVLP